MKIIVLAGGSDQIALIQELKLRGHEVVLVDYFQNPPAKSYADKHIVASTLDVEAVRDITLSEQADLICTACTDQALLTMAKVSEDLSLPCYISYETALNVTNKSYMKEVMSRNGIPTARYVILDSFNESALSEFQYPLVVKPVDCNSSKGVRKVHDRAELVSSLNSAIELSRTHTAIVEEFKAGEEISADFYVDEHDVKLLCATKSVKKQHVDSFTIIGSYYPVITSGQEEILLKIARQIAAAFSLRNTPLLVQLIQQGDIFNVVEFSARMGGGSKYKLIEVLSGVNIMSAYVDLVLGGKPLICPQPQVNCAAMVYLYSKPGIFHELCGLQELKDTSYIHSYFMYKTPGMAITKAEISSDRIAGYLVTASDEMELQQKIAYIDSLVQILDEFGNDMMLHGWQ